MVDIKKKRSAFALVAHALGLLQGVQKAPNDSKPTEEGDDKQATLTESQLSEIAKIVETLSVIAPAAKYSEGDDKVLAVLGEVFKLHASADSIAAETFAAFSGLLGDRVAYDAARIIATVERHAKVEGYEKYDPKTGKGRRFSVSSGKAPAGSAGSVKLFKSSKTTS